MRTVEVPDAPAPVKLRCMEPYRVRRVDPREAACMRLMRKLFFADLHQAVRSEFEGVLREPLPQRWLDLIKELESRAVVPDGARPDRPSPDEGVEQQSENQR